MDDIIFLPSCVITDIKTSIINNKYVKLDLTVHNETLEQSFIITFQESFTWPIIYADSYKSVFNQSIDDDVTNLPRKISCLIKKHPNKVEVLGVGREYQKVEFNLSELDYFTFQDLAFYTALDDKIPNKEISAKNKTKI